MYMCWVCVWKLLAILIVHLYISVASISPSSRRRFMTPASMSDQGTSPLA